MVLHIILACIIFSRICVHNAFQPKCTAGYKSTWNLYHHVLRLSVNQVEIVLRENTSYLPGCMSIDMQNDIKTSFGVLHNSGNITAVADFLLSVVTNLSDSVPTLDRITCNIGINALLNLKREQDVTAVLHYMQKKKISLAADTINIMLSSAFRRKQHNIAEQIFDEYFVAPSSPILPSVRTLNIMVDEFREAKNLSQVAKYFSMFEKYDLKPDVYTYSTMVRIVDSVRVIKNLLQQANNNGGVSVPLIRCAVESVGKLGAPTDALLLQQRMRPLHQLCTTTAAEESWMSGQTLSDVDALLSALLCEASAHKLLSFEDSRDAVELPSGVERHTAAEVALGVLVGSFADTARTSAADDRPLLPCTGKGLCVVFTFLQRSSRASSLSPVHNLNVPGVGPLTVAQCRDRLWAQLAGLPDPIAESVFNGRVFDALLRCYGNDVESARVLWRTQLLPRIVRLWGTDSATFLEVAEKSLEALMFSAGSAGRPDVGLEVATTVRKRQWSLSQRTKIARAYEAGQRVLLSSSPRKSKKAMFSNLLDSGLERSIEAELGVLLTSRDISRQGRFGSLPRIRVQFGENSKNE